MEVFALHKIAEIRARHSNDGVPDPRIQSSHTEPGARYFLVGIHLFLSFFGGTVGGGHKVYMFVNFIIWKKL